MASKKNFAVFDIDGTLIRWQLYHVIVDRLAKRGVLGESAEEHLKIARMKWKRREHRGAFAEYEQSLITIYEEHLPGVEPKLFDSLIDGIIEEYKDQVYTFTRNLAAKLKNQGYMLLAISGSHHELVERIAAHYQFDDAVGTQYTRSGGQFTGEKFIGSHDKQAVLKQLIQKHRLTTTDSYAVGDSVSDVPMLSMVENPIAFNPNRELFEKARIAGWPIVVERKNVTYTLQLQHGSYLLAETN